MWGPKVWNHHTPAPITFYMWRTMCLKRNVSAAVLCVNSNQEKQRSSWVQEALPSRFTAFHKQWAVEVTVEGGQAYRSPPCHMLLNMVREPSKGLYALSQRYLQLVFTASLPALEGWEWRSWYTHPHLSFTTTELPENRYSLIATKEGPCSDPTQICLNQLREVTFLLPSQERSLPLPNQC